MSEETELITPTAEMIYDVALYGALNAVGGDDDGLDRDEFQAMFDRWLASVRREAAAEALTNAADKILLAFELDPEDPLRGRFDATWNSAINTAAGELRARAAEIREGK